MKPNPGHLPDAAAYKGARVNVRLANGELGRSDAKTDTKPGWAADTTRWTLTGAPHDVAVYELVR